MAQRFGVYVLFLAVRRQLVACFLACLLLNPCMLMKARCRSWLWHTASTKRQQYHGKPSRCQWTDERFSRICMVSPIQEGCRNTSFSSSSPLYPLPIFPFLPPALVPPASSSPGVGEGPCQIACYHGTLWCWEDVAATGEDQRSIFRPDSCRSSEEL
eukprot:57032-Hanusia_phi.AAC.2